VGQGGLERPVDDVTRLGRVHHDLAELGHVGEQLAQVDFLLVQRAQRDPLLLADYRDHRLVIQFRVVQAVEQVDRTRARRRHAAPHLTGELRVRARHERAHLLVPWLDELRVAPCPAEGAEHPVDPVARVPEDPVDSPFAEPLQYEVRSLRH
jgi:hypothetical protein